MDFNTYFLIVWGILRYANERGFYHIGRGSGTNSVVAYRLHITDVDPLKLNLYFERFMPPTVPAPPAGGFPWSQGNEERLIKLPLKGLLEANGKKYSGQTPMTSFEGLLNDEEVAEVLTYVRNTFGNSVSVFRPEQVEKVREAVKDPSGFYKPETLLKEHPMEKQPDRQPHEYALQQANHKEDMSPRSGMYLDGDTPQ